RRVEREKSGEKEEEREKSGEERGGEEKRGRGEEKRGKRGGERRRGQGEEKRGEERRGRGELEQESKWQPHSGECELICLRSNRPAMTPSPSGSLFCLLKKTSCTRAQHTQHR